jgi:hypothetical protein
MTRHDDPLDRLLADARYEAPPGLAERLARSALDGAAERRIFWLDVGRSAPKALFAAAAAAVLAVGLTVAVLSSGAPEGAGGPVAVEGAALEDVAVLAVSTTALERHMAEEFAAAPEAGPTGGR